MLEKKLKIIASFTIAAIITILFITFATIFGEFNKPFKNWLALTFGHHWVGKGVIAVVIFFVVVVLHWVASLKMHPIAIDTKVRRLLLVLFATSILSTLTIIGFFVLHFMKVF
ncbi:MAG: hypothetical protein NUV64_03790 [Parcubacteria group bacterium]|nr:hypothetical protein [Parcubacteria group bacterium]MCR4343105.1 hypothetical protein [Patescibacteria group bacterium]